MFHVQSAKLDSAGPNQGVSCQSVMSAAKKENTVSVAVIVRLLQS
jgi:hypothetical protein